MNVSFNIFLYFYICVTYFGRDRFPNIKPQSMKIKNLYYIAILALVLTSFTVLKNDTLKDYLAIGNKIEFNIESYSLKWSANPSPNYYKQEYLRAGDQFPNYQKMIIVEAIKGNLTATQASNAKIAELENWKKSNPIVQYEKLEIKDKNEIIVDFIVSDGKSIYEWNVYHYQEQKNETGNYLVLFCYSYRGYASKKEDANNFLNFVKKTKTETIAKIKKKEVPKIKPK